MTCPQSILHKFIGRKLIKSAVNRATALLTVSNHSASQIRTLFPSKKWLKVIPNSLQQGIKKQEFSHVGRDFCLFVGNEKAHKGLNELLDCWSVLENGLASEQVPDLVVVY